MFDSTIHAKTIARQVRSSDFQPGLLQITEDSKTEGIELALQIAKTGFRAISLQKNHIGGKPVYQHRSYADALLTRHISENVRRVTGVKQSDRQNIVRSIAALAEEGLPYTIMKLDVRSFYETIDTGAIANSIEADAAFSRQSSRLLKSFFEVLEAQQIFGLPRGISLSATLAEYAMRPFDVAMASLKGVRYYSRFVDDIIVVAMADLSESELLDHATKHLPSGLKFSRSKTRGYRFAPCTRASKDRIEHKIDFLGYSFSISEALRIDNAVQRRVHLDISDKKISKIKRRVAKSLLHFNKDGNFNDLVDRIKLLTSNFSFIDGASGQKRFAGLRYNYSLIDEKKSDAIASLDRFLWNAIMSDHPQNRIKPILNNNQIRTILGYRFRSGFAENRFFKFDDNDLARITRCWSHA